MCCFDCVVVGWQGGSDRWEMRRLERRGEGRELDLANLEREEENSFCIGSDGGEAGKIVESEVRVRQGVRVHVI